MKTKLTLLLGLLASALCPAAFAQGTAFTYQGRFNADGAAFTGNAEFQPTLWNAASNGTPVATNNPATLVVPVTNGLFTMLLDFGSAFPGGDRWLQIDVRTSIGAFTPLAPRQKLTPTPYAITAGNLTGTLSAGQLSGTLPSAQLSGIYSGAVTFNSPASSFTGAHTGNGTGLTNVNALTLGGFNAASFWRTAGNTGTSAGANFLGTSDNQALELKVNNVRALRLEPNTNGAPNVVGGSPNNVVDAGVIGAFIGGGGATNFGNHTNRIASNFSVIGGGFDNLIHTNSSASTIGGGEENAIYRATAAAVVGGSQNIITNSTRAFIGAGFLNSILGGSEGMIGGGIFNDIISQSGGCIGGGTLNQLGGTNHAGSSSGVVNVHNTIAGGVLNWIADGAAACFIGGGRNNFISNGVSFATVPGGQDNRAGGDFSFAAGRRAKADHDGTFVWADSQNANFGSTGSNQFLIRASGGVGIGTNNPASALHVNGAVNIAGGDLILAAGSQVLADSGSNAAPGISFRGDSNTGMLHPVANTITFVTAGNERLRIESAGNVGIGTNNPAERLHVIGNILASGTVTGGSDRNVKEHFSSVNPRDVLEKVSALPITEWNYKADNETLRHIGPMAQDFYSAFNVGLDDKHISMVDADGVALAAIQGLNQKLSEQETRLKNKDSEIQELRQAVAALQKTVSLITSKTQE